MAVSGPTFGCVEANASGGPARLWITDDRSSPGMTILAAQPQLMPQAAEFGRRDRFGR